MKTILLKFVGPLQSWGTSSHFESRHTDLYPSKSAVIGMIAAAFGYRRSEDEKIRRLNQLHFAVRADQEGKITEDYQTAHKYKYNPEPVAERTYVTHRYYLEDAVFLVAIGHENDQWKRRLKMPMLPDGGIRKLTLSLSVEGENIRNHYSFRLFPELPEYRERDDVLRLFSDGGIRTAVSAETGRKFLR